MFLSFVASRRVYRTCSTISAFHGIPTPIACVIGFARLVIQHLLLLRHLFLRRFFALVSPAALPLLLLLVGRPCDCRRRFLFCLDRRLAVVLVPRRISLCR